MCDFGSGGTRAQMQIKEIKKIRKRKERKREGGWGGGVKQVQKPKLQSINDDQKK